MHEYALIQNNTCVVVGQLRQLPDRDDIIARVAGVPDVGWTLDNGEWSAPEPVIPEQQTALSPIEFMELFTHDEQQGIVAAASQNPAVGLFWEKLKLTPTVSLSDPRTMAGVQALEFSGLIQPGRADEILS